MIKLPKFRNLFFGGPCKAVLLLISPVLIILIFSSCLTSASKAEEYYAIGTAYMELQKYAEAESWLNKAKFHQTTKMASIFNLGRIAYETGRYKEALSHFEQIAAIDSENISALRAAAYTSIRMEDMEKAALYYEKVLSLVPESHDEGLNYAIVLMAMDRAPEAEELLKRFNNTENPDALLVLARSQKAQSKVEAADAYSASLSKKDNPVVRAEYAAYLLEAGHKDKALAEYKLVLEKISDDKKEEIKKIIEELETDGKSGSEAK